LRIETTNKEKPGGVSLPATSRLDFLKIEARTTKALKHRKC
jgi:hypothetical protein